MHRGDGVQLEHGRFRRDAVVPGHPADCCTDRSTQFLAERCTDCTDCVAYGGAIWHAYHSANGCTNCGTNGCTDGYANCDTNGCTDGYANCDTNGCTNRGTNGCTDECANCDTNGSAYRSANGCTDECANCDTNGSTDYCTDRIDRVAHDSADVRRGGVGKQQRNRGKQPAVPYPSHPRSDYYCSHVYRDACDAQEDSGR
jgi:hypothetical protein